MNFTELEQRLDTVDSSLAKLERQVAQVRTNQTVTIKLVKAILKELELRREIADLEKDLEESNGSDAPSPVGS